jgi:integrase
MLPQPPQVKMLREPQRDPFFIDDAAFTKLYDACQTMTLPANRHYAAEDWLRALLCFAYMTGWRIGEILELRRDHLDFDAATATVDAESTKGRREARVELHPL